MKIKDLKMNIFNNQIKKITFLGKNRKIFKIICKKTLFFIICLNLEFNINKIYSILTYCISVFNFKFDINKYLTKKYSVFI